MKEKKTNNRLSELTNKYNSYNVVSEIESNLSKLVNLVPNDSMRYFLLNTEIHVTPSLNAILVSTLFSLAVGIIFGYYPANKGAKMQPVEALRYE